MAGEDEFAEFSATVSTVVSAISSTVTAVASQPTPLTGRTAKDFGPWYAIWERHSLSDFYGEVAVLVIIVLLVGVQIWGTRANRKIATQWMKQHAGLFAQEFALVGFPENGKPITLDSSKVDESTLVRENSPVEFLSYASGRQGIAYAHITFKLIRRNQPLAHLIEKVLSFFLDSIPPPADTVTITVSPFDGSDAPGGNSPSKYDNFVFGIVNKRIMRKLREERYDLSLTKTTEGEINGLPVWTVVMSESSELSNIVTSDDIKEAIKNIKNNSFDYLIATDQPVDKPLTLDETLPKKRLSLRIPLNSDATATGNLIESFIRFSDHLSAKAHFRPEVARKIKATRDAQSKKLRQQEEQEKAEEREKQKAEEKRKERDAKLRSMSADEQKKFLDREKEKETRKSMKKMSRKG